RLVDQALSARPRRARRGRHGRLRAPRPGLEEALSLDSIIDYRRSRPIHPGLVSLLGGPTMLRSWLRPLALTLALATLGTGCATTVATPRAEIRSSRSSDLINREAGEGQVDKTHHHAGAIAALYVAGAFLFVGAVIADVLILPVSAPCHRP